MDKIQTLKTMVSMVQDGETSLLGGKFEHFGELLHESWLLKKSLASKISNHQIEEAYEAARSAGAWGGKLLGAGGGGFMLFD